MSLEVTCMQPPLTLEIDVCPPRQAIALSSFSTIPAWKSLSLRDHNRTVPVIIVISDTPPTEEPYLILRGIIIEILRG